MIKIFTYLRYLLDYLKNGDITSVISSIRYISRGKSHENDRIIRTSIGKFHCRKNTNDFQFANYFYEWGVKKYILRHKNEFNVFIDGGACIGDYSILMSRFMEKCIAFEPVIFNYRAMLENIEINQLAGKIKTFQIALGDIDTEAYFVFNPVNTGASFKSKDNSPSDCKAEQRALDSLFPKMGILPDDRVLFKLDLEGMEEEAILGASNFIRDHENLTLIIEDKHSGDKKIMKTLTDIARFDFGIIDDFNIYARKITN